jgi:bacterioferritin-associated ferredoxin
MIVCICHRVSDRAIARAVQDGCTSFDELQFELSVATACGKCHDCARETFHHHAELASQQRAHGGADTPHGKFIPIAAFGQHEPMAKTSA